MPIEQIADVVREQRGEIEITLAAEAAEYRKTLAILAEQQSGRSARLPIAAGSVPGMGALAGAGAMTQSADGHKVELSRAAN